MSDLKSITQLRIEWAARTDVDRGVLNVIDTLLKEVEDLRAQLAQMTQDYQTVRDSHDENIKILVQVTAERDFLKSIIQHDANLEQPWGRQP